MMSTKQRLILQIVLVEIVAVSLLAVIHFMPGIIPHRGLLPASTPQNNQPGTPPPAVGEKGDQVQPSMEEIEVNDTLTMSLVGDIMLASGVGEAINKNGPDYPWLQVRNVLLDDDVSIGNLECAVGQDKHKAVPDKQYTFIASPRALAGAREAGMDVLTLANNHILDFGTGALQETLAWLDNYKFHYTGAGNNAGEAFKPVIIKKDGINVGILAFTYVFPQGWWVAGEKRPGVASGYDYALVKETVRKVSSQTDFTVISLHWGEELAEKPSEKQVKLAHDLVNWGADLIYGHHPHVLQGLELYEGKIIAYSVGNFIFTLSRDLQGRQSVILQVDLNNGGITGARVIPTWIEYGQTNIATEKKASAVIKRLQSLSQSFGTEINDNGEILFKRV